MDNLTEREKACIRQLAKWYEQGNVSHVVAASSFGFQDVPDSEFDALIRMMNGLGVVSRINHRAKGEWNFTVEHKAVLLARDFDEQDKSQKKPGDIVEMVNEKIRRSPWLAWILIAFFALMAISTFINQTIGIIQNMGWMEKPK